MEFEHKTVAIDLKAVDGSGEISGYASVYNEVDKGLDMVMSGAFDASIAEGRKIKMLWQHDPSQPIGVWTEATSDEKGLKVKGKILDTISKGKEALELVRAGAIDGLSIGYKAVKTSYAEMESGLVRKIEQADLWETSLVTFPMNEKSVVTDVKQLQGPIDVERLLRKAGVPGGFAKLIALHGFEGATKKLKDGPRDEDDDAATREQFSALLETLKGLKETIHAQG